MNDIDSLISRGDISALVIREHLVPCEGLDAVVFPPTFAIKDKESDYNIDWFDGGSVCIMDTVGSQSNRTEPLFKAEPYSNMVPQVIVQAGDKQINLLDAGHRAGDAIVRCSDLQTELQRCFKAAITGNHVPLAKIAPTSLVFGVWDSRETGAKVPRLVASTIRAYNVRPLKRSLQYFPATKYVAEGLTDAPKNDKERKLYSKRGFVEVPRTSRGGVIADGGIRRHATLALAALRLLRAGSDDEQTLKLQRYILGLALIAFTAPSEAYLRQGCLLVGDPEHPCELIEVHRSGKRLPCGITHEAALAYATAAAKDFGVGPDRTVAFDKKRAEADLKKKESEGQA